MSSGMKLNLTAHGVDKRISGDDMTYDELLALILHMTDEEDLWYFRKALKSVVELHKSVIHALPNETCLACQDLYPCPTIQAIEKELK